MENRYEVHFDGLAWEAFQFIIGHLANSSFEMLIFPNRLSFPAE